MVLFSCGKSDSDVEPIDLKKDKWVTSKILDSLGNSYIVAATYDSKLQIRVEDAKGVLLFSEYCPTIDSTEIPVRADSVIVTLVAPNKYINVNDASMSIILPGTKKDGYDHVQLLANLSLDTKKFYTKKYKVEEPLDWSYVWWNDAVVQWYQSTILVREGTQEYLNGGGFMGLGSRGSQLVCYERDFSVRYVKDIDVTAAYYPYSGGNYIPINNTEDMGFRTDIGLITRSAILVSTEDQWAGVKPIVWQVDLKHALSLPSNYEVKITDYNIIGDLVRTTFETYDGSGKLVSTLTRDWDLRTGMPRTKL